MSTSGVFVRFVAAHRVDDDLKRPRGIFRVAGALMEDDVFDVEQDALAEELAWFNANLAVPGGCDRPDAVFWFRDAAVECIRRSWWIADLLRRHAVPVRVETTRFPGLVVYADELQVMAVPKRGTYRYATRRPPRRTRRRRTRQRHRP
jgi:hypothetical protein